MRKNQASGQADNRPVVAETALRPPRCTRQDLPEPGADRPWLSGELGPRSPEPLGPGNGTVSVTLPIAAARALRHGSECSGQVSIVVDTLISPAVPCAAQSNACSVVDTATCD